ncbi:DUF433 domain-containing protein [Salegentibacter sp. Hel_I_6]|uniref:DUF433 domain-containing protein n=1 Tax=Salegentibacter sp. Hel_I_6 TaxID=1250278 RepID=UPI00055DBC66|nr:DUF433 domain-containing protein [Salegentibacter sp. Hel_I_6]
MIFENKPQLGFGIYTPAEIAQILRLPYYKVNRWIDKYWDGELGHEFEKRYSWKTENSKAVSFHTLVEFYVMMQLADAGVKTRKVLEAHKELSQLYKTHFPFALKEVLDGINTDGKRIFLNLDDTTITLDGTKQLNLSFIKLFFKKLEFDANNLASKLWPLGKEKSILIDPTRKFGHPILDMKNIYPETIFNHFKAGDPIEYISYVYELTEKEVRDAIEYMDAA